MAYKFRVVLVVVLFSALGLNSLSVGASPFLQATTTATRDFRTPPNTPTAGGGPGSFFPTSAPMDFTCPVGLPIGYGTLTPGALWSMICFACVPTNTPVPTYDFNEVIPTQTARFCEMFPDVEGCWTPTPSPTGPSPTPTGSATPAYLCGGSATATPFYTPTYSYSGGLVENTSGSITYTGTWTTTTCSICADNSQTISKTAGRKFAYTFYGTQITLSMRKASDGGKADVRIDGSLVQTLDLYAASGTDYDPVFNVALGTHTIELTVLGTKTAPSTDEWIWFHDLNYVGAQLPTPTSFTGGVDCESSGAGYTCLSDTATYAALSFAGASPGAGGDRNVQFNLTPNVLQQITYRVTVIHRETSSFSSNHIADQIDIETTAGTDITIGYLSSADGVDVTDSEVFNGYASVITGAANDNLVFHLGTAADYAITGGSLDFLVEVWSYVQCELVTATPGGTATPGVGYCYTISTDEADPDDIEFWGDSGELACFVVPSIDGEELADAGGIISFLWDAFIADIFVAVAGGMVSPAMTICLQPYDFISFDFFGVMLNFTWFVDLMLVAYVLRHLQSRGG